MVSALLEEENGRTSLHPCEQREGNGTKRILTIGRAGNEDRGKLRRKLEALCLTLKYDFFSPLFIGGFFNPPLAPGRGGRR